jgi:hypothetical protein
VSPNAPGSVRVLDKAEVKKVRVYKWEGEWTFLAETLQENIIVVLEIWVLK